MCVCVCALRRGSVDQAEEMRRCDESKVEGSHMQMTVWLNRCTGSVFKNHWHTCVAISVEVYAYFYGGPSIIYFLQGGSFLSACIPI